ncbi:hypothetical protein M902_1822 [Bacteriovorax sp. BAL6_X]|uniref:hypothetical protein n=1 Tax=Bacteriovorax sp. BAL6_X TaxID=1201290 RepID=UPI00038607BE|nr:hypothetical protein [Bacteriovorax sp. BAL6_X]EPZ52189.1 hypothetical protein M902_1822 [Bacteriovorax sp. BAL6_X]
MSLAKTKIGEIERRDKNIFIKECLTKSHKKTIYIENHFSLSGKEKVLLFFDQTIFGNGKVGVLFTSEKLHFNNDIENFSLRYDEIERIDIEKGMLGYFILVNSKKMPSNCFTSEEVAIIQDAITVFREFNDNDIVELGGKTFAEKSKNVKYNDTEGKHHCTNCNAEGEIEKNYSRGSFLIAFALIFAGGIPAFFYVFFYMKSWKACSECEATNLVALDKWRKNNPSQIEKEIESVA